MGKLFRAADVFRARIAWRRRRMKRLAAWRDQRAETVIAKVIGLRAYSRGRGWDGAVVHLDAVRAIMAAAHHQQGPKGPGRAA